jgi:hypothetical protein
MTGVVDIRGGAGPGAGRLDRDRGKAGGRTEDLIEVGLLDSPEGRRNDGGLCDESPASEIDSGRPKENDWRSWLEGLEPRAF